MKVKQLTDILKKIRFNPNKPGPMKIIVDVNDPRFWQQRAIELIQESLSIDKQLDHRQFQNSQEQFQSVQVLLPQSVERLVKAAQLIILAAAALDVAPVKEIAVDVAGLSPSEYQAAKKDKKLPHQGRKKKRGRTKKKARRDRKKT